MAIPDYQTFMLPVLRYAGDRPKESVMIRDLFGVLREGVFPERRRLA